MGRKAIVGTGFGPKLLRVIKPAAADLKLELIKTTSNEERLKPRLDFYPTGTIPQPSKIIK
jgi:hypothetical protein